MEEILTKKGKKSVKYYFYYILVQVCKEVWTKLCIGSSGTDVKSLIIVQNVFGMTKIGIVW
jgi:hypothetical protein